MCWQKRSPASRSEIDLLRSRQRQPEREPSRSPSRSTDSPSRSPSRSTAARARSRAGVAAGRASPLPAMACRLQRPRRAWDSPDRAGRCRALAGPGTDTPRLGRERPAPHLRDSKPTSVGLIVTMVGPIRRGSRSGCYRRSRRAGPSSRHRHRVIGSSPARYRPRLATPHHPVSRSGRRVRSAARCRSRAIESTIVGEDGDHRGTAAGTIRRDVRPAADREPGPVAARRPRSSGRSPAGCRRRRPGRSRRRRSRNDRCGERGTSRPDPERERKLRGARLRGRHRDRSRQATGRARRDPRCEDQRTEAAARTAPERHGPGGADLVGGQP